MDCLFYFFLSLFVLLLLFENYFSLFTRLIFMYCLFLFVVVVPELILVMFKADFYFSIFFLHFFFVPELSFVM